MSKLEAQLRALVDEVDGGERPRFEDWENVLALVQKAAAIGAEVEREECAQAVRRSAFGSVYPRAMSTLVDTIRARGGK